MVLPNHYVSGALDYRLRLMFVLIPVVFGTFGVVAIMNAPRSGAMKTFGIGLTIGAALAAVTAGLR